VFVSDSSPSANVVTGLVANISAKIAADKKAAVAMIF
jgi:hypothetical protein